MKAIIFTEKTAAEAALATCTANIPRDKASKVGGGRFVRLRSKNPYSVILAHPTEAKWALVSNPLVEELLNMTAVELDNTWFPKSAIFDSPPV